MSNAAPADGRRMAETACGLGSEGPTSAVTRGSAAGAQPSHPNNCSDCGKGITIASIKKAVAKHYHLTEFVLVSRQSRREVSIPRQIGMAIARGLTAHSRTSIGRHFGGRDPTTVLYAERAVVRRYVSTPTIERALNAILAELSPR